MINLIRTKIIIALFMSLICIESEGATVIDFDDLSHGLVPVGYAGLTWGTSILARPDADTTSFHASNNTTYSTPHSLPNYILNGYGVPDLWFEFPSPVIFNGAWMAFPRNNIFSAQKVRFVDDSGLTSNWLELTDSPQFLEANFYGSKRIYVQPIGRYSGVQATGGWGGDGWVNGGWYTMDDITYEIAGSADCGSSNGHSFTEVPTTNLCNTGTPSIVSIDNEVLNWSCKGSGTFSNCSSILSDFTQPTLTVSALINGSVTNNATINVSGTVSDSSGIKSLTINGKPVSIAGDGSYTYPVTLVNGANIISTVATDNVNNQTTDTRTITLDTTSPTLTISAPADNSLTGTATVNVSGTVSESASVKARIGTGTWQTALISGSNFDIQLVLFSGQNTIEMMATDQAGNSVVTTSKLTITYLDSAPNLSVTSPNKDIATISDNIDICGTVGDSFSIAAITLTVDDMTFTPDISYDGSFCQNVLLSADKTYFVAVTATDRIGNISTVHRNIIKTSPLSKPVLMDAQKVLDAVVGKTALTASEKIRYDVAPVSINNTPHGDGVIDAADVIATLRRTVGIGSW